MSSSEDAVKRVIEAFERSNWSEIDVRSGDVRIHLSTHAPSSPPGTPPGPTAPPTSPASDRSVSDDAHVPERPDPSPPADPPPAGAHVVVSPSPGIFWRSPEPGLPPFTDVGETVDASATVCIVEVMKLMNHVKAGVGGEVVAVYADNGVALRKGQALFAIVPSGTAP